MFWTSRVTWILNSWSTNWAFGGSWVVEIWPLTLWVSRVLKYPNKCLEGLKFFFMSTWWWDSKNMKEIVLTMAFWATYKIAQPIQPIWEHILASLSLPSKSHRENSISSIILESPHQVDMKTVVKSSKHFFGFFNTLETHGDDPWLKVLFCNREDTIQYHGGLRSRELCQAPLCYWCS